MYTLMRAALSFWHQECNAKLLQAIRLVHTSITDLWVHLSFGKLYHTLFAMLNKLQRVVLEFGSQYCMCVAQFAAGGIIRLPKYDVMMAKADANRKPVLAPEDIRIATMYAHP